MNTFFLRAAIRKFKSLFRASSQSVQADASKFGDPYLKELLGAGLHQLGFVYKTKSALSRVIPKIPCLALGDLSDSSSGYPLTVNLNVVRLLKSRGWVTDHKMKPLGKDTFVVKYTNETKGLVLSQVVVFDSSSEDNKTRIKYAEVYIQ